MEAAKTDYVTFKKVDALPRLPEEGSLDLTYRCNNNCRHCWLRIVADSPERKQELSLLEIKNIVDEAKLMGCRTWGISGGEPMLRPDFYEIFDYITGNCIFYSINTNGTLITPKIARLLKRKGTKMVALYAATAGVHDYITRCPGSFEATMAGFAYLKEAGAGFIVQLIPMKDNFHQLKDMVKLAESLSKHYRIGAAWLYLSACGDPKINQEIANQRLEPNQVVDLDKPDISGEDAMRDIQEQGHCAFSNDKYLLASCIANRRVFHIDPYGRMTFCCFVKDPGLRYDLRKGTFSQAWDEFIPSLANKVKATKEYLDNCGSCQDRQDCRWCAVYAYLEHRRFGAKVDYLCKVAREFKQYKQTWKEKHRRFYEIGGITIQVDSDLAITEETFHPKFKKFQVLGPGQDTITLRHHFSLPDINSGKLGQEIYRKPPWAIYKNNDSWIYLGISPVEEDKTLHRVAVFNHNHSRANIYSPKEEDYLKGGLQALTLFPTDQILLARILADREGCFLHACGVILGGKGLLFVGHSEAGKSTIAGMLEGRAEILCDDRMIVRRSQDGFKIYGTWSHGDVPDVSANSAALKAILFLEKAQGNKTVPIDDKKEINKRLLSCLIKPFVTVDWWEKTLELIGKIPGQIPCYVLQFDKSGAVADTLKKI